MESLKSRHNLIIQNFTASSSHEKWSKRPKTVTYVKDFFHKINKDMQENQEQNALDIRGYDVT